MFTGAGAPRQLAAAMHGAWVDFARDGDPGWPVYDLTTRPTRIFDEVCDLVEDPEGRERRAWEGLR